MVSTVFETIDDAMAARHRGILLYVRVGGIAVRATEAHIVHDVGGIGQATVYLPKPAPDSLALNATLEVEIGHPGTVRRRFFGYIPAWKRSISNRGHSIRVVAVGQLSYLNYPNREGTSLASTTLKNVFRSLCEQRNVDTYFADETYYPDGSPIILGGNESVDGGDIRFDAETSPHSFLQAVSPLFGYRVHDAPDGAPRLSRVLGIPIPVHATGALNHAQLPGNWIKASANLSVRETPTAAATIFGVFFADDLAFILDGPTINDELTDDNYWYYVRVLNGPTGWVAGRRTNEDFPSVYDVTLSEPVYWYDEGENVRASDWDISREPIVTFVEVYGKSYTELSGGHAEIHSTPDTVPENEYIAPQDYIHKRYTSQYLVTAQQADGARNAKEIELAAPAETFTWKTAGRPDVQPGEIAVLTFPTWGIENVPVWIMRLADDVDDAGGYQHTVTGWAGKGEPLPAGDDCDEIPIATSPRHIGNQTLSWYADPTPNGEEQSISFTNPFDDYSSLKIEGLAHGSNSYNNKTASEGSKIEIWQKPDPALPDSAENELRRIGSVDLPTLDEEVARRRPYGTSNRYWTSFSLPIGGRLKAGAATLKLIAGENPDGHDDYEVKNVTLRACGVGFPDLPGSY
jgi:hypothetical protein